MLNNPTVEAYDEYAQIYDDEVVDFWNNFPSNYINDLAEQLPGRRILNLGSGSGRDAVLLRDCGLEVVCVDASKAMIEITTNLGFESHLADFSYIDFSQSSFDGVWAYTSLIHIPKEVARRVIIATQRLLKSDGVFTIGVIEGDTAGMIERKTMPGMVRYFKNYSSKELRELIEPLGFKFLQEQRYQPHNSVYLNQLYKRS
jgi:SAM-dependent methyltransferase